MVAGKSIVDAPEITLESEVSSLGREFYTCPGECLCWVRARVYHLLPFAGGERSLPELRCYIILCIQSQELQSRYSRWTVTLHNVKMAADDDFFQSFLSRR